MITDRLQRALWIKRQHSHLYRYRRKRKKKKGEGGLGAIDDSLELHPYEDYLKTKGF